MLQKKNFFTLFTMALIILMPFYVFLKVLFEHQIGIPLFWVFIKEGIIFILLVLLAKHFITEKKLPKFDFLDYGIFAYFWYGVLITLLQGWGIAEIFHGGRYDFLFLVVFLVYRHGKEILQLSLKQAVKLFIFSWAVALFMWITLRFIWEEFLTLAGYDLYRGSWVFEGRVPIYHGVESSGMRRFQGALDGPNQMWFFLLTYMGAVYFFIKKKFEFHHGLIGLLLFILLILTFSRSALLGFIGGISFLFLLNIKTIFQKHTKALLALLAGAIVLLWIFFALFQHKIYEVIVRPSSTTGHFERMEIGLEQFMEKPFGRWLASSGPWFRQVYTGEITKEVEEKYIPESWFVQQLVEGGVIFFLLFCGILSTILWRVYGVSKSFFVTCVGVGVMAIFLHIFEATYVSVLLFLFLGLIVEEK